MFCVCLSVRSGGVFLNQELLEKLHQNWKEVLIGFLIALSLFLGFLFLKKEDKEVISEEWESFSEIDSIEEVEAEEIGDVEEVLIYIDVKGEVVKPGVYQIEANKRVIDAVKLAGGETNEANLDHLNLALKLTDQMVVSVPHVDDEEGDVEIVTVETEQGTEKVNINTADLAQLMTLEGIGPKKAEGIIHYREENGSFKTIEEIKEVSGIGDKTYEKFREKIETEH